MLKLTMKPGEYIRIGENINVAFVGGSSSRMNILVEAPKEFNIVRNKVLEKNKEDSLKSYYKDPDISEEAKERIRQIIIEEKRKHMQMKCRRKEGKVSETG